MNLPSDGTNTAVLSRELLSLPGCDDESVQALRFSLSCVLSDSSSSEELVFTWNSWNERHKNYYLNFLIYIAIEVELEIGYWKQIGWKYCKIIIVNRNHGQLSASLLHINHMTILLFTSTYSYFIEGSLNFVHEILLSWTRFLSHFHNVSLLSIHLHFLLLFRRHLQRDNMSELTELVFLT